MRSFREFAQDSSQGPGSPSFQAWFQDSKVVDKSGKPILCYHGTIHNFDLFKTEPDQFDKLYVGDVGAGMLGAFFTESKAVADTYPLSTPLDATRSVVAAYLRIQNPRRFRTLPQLRDDMLELYGGREKFYSTDSRNRFATARELAKQYKARLMRDGYDGVIFKEGPAWHPQKKDMKATTWIAFSNDQIRIVNRLPVG